MEIFNYRIITYIFKLHKIRVIIKHLMLKRNLNNTKIDSGNLCEEVLT